MKCFTDFVNLHMYQFMSKYTLNIERNIDKYVDFQKIILDFLSQYPSKEHVKIYIMNLEEDNKRKNR